MSGLNVTYKAKDLAALADGLMEMASAKREEAGASQTQRRQQNLIHEAIGMESAADVVRMTTLDPSMGDDDAEAEES